MSRDETLRDKLARLKEARLRHSEQHRRDIEQMKADMEAARTARREAHRLQHEAHHARHAERARKAGRRPLDVAAIASAAVAIADAQGLEEVSMRKVAAVLGAGTMSLYHYVRTKEDLFAAMDDIIMGEILVPERELKGGWRKGMTAIALHTRDAYRRHPWALTIQTAGGEPGMNGLRHVEQSLAVLQDTGLSFEDKFAMIVIMDDFVFGHALRAIGTEFESGNAEASMERIAEFMDKNVDPGEYPAIMASVGDGTLSDFVLKMAASFKPDVWFDVGLESILEGLAKRFGLEG